MPANRRNVFETIREKRQWHTPPDRDAAKLGFRGWHSRGYLPHFDLPGLVQFLNYRLDDALPASLRHEWAALLEIGDELKRRTKIEDYLDRGRGSCLLRDPRAAAVVEENWLHSDGQDYRLLAWAVMPNHVHLLVEIWAKPQAQLVKDWKGLQRPPHQSPARATRQAVAGRLLGSLHSRRSALPGSRPHYIEANPVKAGLVKTPEQWPFSSARFRDEYHRLKLPAKPD